MVTTKIDGIDYELATTLRVAYMIQGQNNHEAYSKVFARMGDMTLEEQVAVLYTAFKCANPDVLMTKERFFEYYLDHYSLSEVLSQLELVIRGITGVDSKVSEVDSTPTDAVEPNEGN